MRREGFIEGLQDRWADAALTNEDNRFQWVCKAAQVAALRAVEARAIPIRSVLRGRLRPGSRGVTGHENLRLGSLGLRP